MPDNNAKEEIDLLNKNYFVLFSSDAGQQILEDLKRACFYNISTFISGSKAIEIVYREGARAILLYMLDRIEKGKKLVK